MKVAQYEVLALRFLTRSVPVGAIDSGYAPVAASEPNIYPLLSIVPAGRNPHSSIHTQHFVLGYEAKKHARPASPESFRGQGR
jgi:hypothetical protein